MSKQNKEKYGMQISTVNLEFIDLKDIKPYQNNPRINDKAIDAVAESIRQFGFKQPIVLDINKVIVCGHTRYKASQKLGLIKVPCIIANDLTDAQIKAYRLADNKTAELAEWDLDLLEVELSSLSLDGLNMANFGFEMQDLVVDELDTVIDDNYDPDIPDEPMVQVGDIWQLGNHRLICGDCTIKSTLSKLMDGKVADICITDPPYNMDYESVQKQRMKGKLSPRVRENKLVNIQNDKLNDAQFAKFIDDSFLNVNFFLKPSGIFYCFHIELQGQIFREKYEKHFLFDTMLIWVKNHFSLSRKDYHRKHELILYGYKQPIKGKEHYFINDKTQDTVFEDTAIDYKTMTKTEAVKMIKQIRENANENTTVLYENKPEKSLLHPTMKPIKLLARLMRNSSKQGGNVLDIFGGSGSTLIAAEQMHRNAFICEIEPKYCDVIIKRWEEFTKQKAIKL